MQPFEILMPRGEPMPLVVGIPHTGTELPAEIAQRLRPEMRSQPMCDWHLHLLYADLVELGITVVHSVYSRFLADLNRPPDSQALYPGRFETGLVPTQTFQGEPIWQDPPGQAEIDEWRLALHAPYHDALSTVLDRTVAEFGRAWFVDAHSVASSASLLHGPLEDEIYLGDRDGVTNDGTWTNLFERGFSQHSYSVARNAPYKGGYNTAHYGANAAIEAVQIEMCQRCYMDEAEPEQGPSHPKFETMRGDLFDIFEGLAVHIRQENQA